MSGRQLTQAALTGLLLGGLTATTCTVRIPGVHVDIDDHSVFVKAPGVKVDVQPNNIHVDVPFFDVKVHGSGCCDDD